MDQKPPRPVSFGNKGVWSDVNNSSHSLPRDESLGDISTDSRDVLRSELRKRRMSLTPQELGFLEELIDHGNEVDLTVAHKTLCDDDLFFNDENQGGDNNALLDTSRHATSDPGPNDTVSSEDMKEILRTSAKLRSGDTLGSVKRQEHLQQRRQSTMYGNLWKAHEHGITMTGSRQRSKSIACLREEKAIMFRRSSFLSVETENLLSNGGLPTKEVQNGVFRRTQEDVVFRRPLSPKGRISNNGRKVSWDGRASSALVRPRRPTLRRLASEGSRKSVSFAEYDAEDGDHPTRLPGIPRRVLRKREVSTDTEVSLLETDLGDEDTEVDSKRPAPFRSDSLSSIPSLHHPNPVRSDSVSSIPSLHHPNPVRSDSIASIHSIHHAHRVHSESSIPKEEYDVLSLTSIPSLHHGHPLQDDASLATFRTSTTTQEARDPAWSDPLNKPDELHKPQLLRHPSQPMQRPVLMRHASRNVYNGEGIEVEELPPEIEIDSISKARKFRSMLSLGDTTVGSVLSTGSFDGAINRDSIFRDLRRSLSDEGRSSFFLGATSPLSLRTSNTSVDTLRPEEEEEDLDASWDMHAEESPKGHYDAWGVFNEDPSFGAGGGNAVPFYVLGTSADDEASTPHVLSPPLMDSLRNFFPYSLTESNFWMKYSLLRDGASYHSLLQKVRGTAFTIIAIETVDGEVFGSFTSHPWRKNWKYFGDGESFLWRMRKSRATPCFDVFDQAKMESELDVYPWTGENDCIQLCTHDKLAVGGGSRNVDEKKDDVSTTEYGFGLSIEKNLLYGTSTSCATFASPPLSKMHSDGSPFEIVNLEVWAMTPCHTLEEAEKLELGQLFLRTN